MLRTFSSCLLTLLLALSPSRATAVTTASSLQPAEETPEQKQERIDRAKALFRAGQALVEIGDYTNAVAKFEQAYSQHAPELHVFNFNIGDAAFAGGDCQKAKIAFERFLELVQEHPERPTAQERLAQIERGECVSAQQGETPPPPPTVVPIEDDAPDLTRRGTREAAATKEEEDNAERRLQDRQEAALLGVGITSVILGLGALVGGATTAALARRDAKVYNEAGSPSESGYGDTYYDAMLAERQDNVNKLNKMTPALMGLGGVLVVAGAVMITVQQLLHKKRARSIPLDDQLSRRLMIAPSLAQRSVGVAAGLRF